MSLRVVLDEHVHPAVASLLRERGFDALAMREWHDGRYVSRSDEEILRVAHGEQRTLVTYDLGSIPALLTRFLESGIEHAGVIFISPKTIQPRDVGAIAGSLERLLRLLGDRGLRNGVLFASK